MSVSSLLLVDPSQNLILASCFCLQKQFLKDKQGTTELYDQEWGRDYLYGEDETTVIGYPDRTALMTGKGKVALEKAIEDVGPHTRFELQFNSKRMAEQEKEVANKRLKWVGYERSNN